MLVNLLSAKMSYAPCLIFSLFFFFSKFRGNTVWIANSLELDQKLSNSASGLVFVKAIVIAASAQMVKAHAEESCDKTEAIHTVKY